MKLYDYAAAPNPRRVAIFLAEKGIELETVQVDLMTGEHKGEAFTAFNPMQDVPALELDDGSCLNQVNAICQYLEELYPDNPLYGRNPLERARVESWNHRIQDNGVAAVAEAFRNASPNFKGRALPGPRSYEQIPKLAERGLKRVDDFFSMLDEHLGNSEFIVGDYFSVADITAYMTIEFARWVKKSMPEQCTNLQRWHAQVGSRPSISG